MVKLGKKHHLKITCFAILLIVPVTCYLIINIIVKQTSKKKKRAKKDKDGESLANLANLSVSARLFEKMETNQTCSCTTLVEYTSRGVSFAIGARAGGGGGLQPPPPSVLKIFGQNAYDSSKSTWDKLFIESGFCYQSARRWQLFTVWTRL